MVEGAQGCSVSLYDLSGRLLATKVDYDDLLRFDVPASGGYLLKADGYQARKIVIIK